MFLGCITAQTVAIEVLKLKYAQKCQYIEGDGQKVGGCYFNYRNVLGGLKPASSVVSS